MCHMREISQTNLTHFRTEGMLSQSLLLFFILKVYDTFKYSQKLNGCLVSFTRTNAVLASQCLKLCYLNFGAPVAKTRALAEEHRNGTFFLRPNLKTLLFLNWKEFTAKIQ